MGCLTALTALTLAHSMVVAGARPAPPAQGAAPARPEPAGAALARLANLYTELHYDQVVVLARTLVAREDLNLAQRVEAFRLLGSALAVVQDPVDAEAPFRLLLRTRPDFDLPRDTSPKILAVFRKVQAEEKALAAQLQEVERARLIEGMKLVGELPRQGKGGRPVHFNLRLRDLTGAVTGLRVPYRRAGQAAYSALALAQEDDGAWRGQIPGEFTADVNGFSLEYYLESFDERGALLTVGAETKPLVLALSPGQVPGAAPPLPRWAFFASSGAAAGLGLASGALSVALSRAQGDFRRYSQSGEVLDGAALTAKEQRGEQLATATNAAIIGAAVAAVAALVVAPLVDWDPEETPALH